VAQISNFDAVEWHWKIAGEDEALYLVLTADIEFRTRFGLASLLGFSVDGQTFSTQDACIYSEYREQFKSLPLNEEGRFSLAINATVARLYIKPLANKSWYFSPTYEANVRTLGRGDYVSAQALSQGLYLVLDTDESTSTIMLLSSGHRIDENRHFLRGKTLRVHNDRLSLELYQIQEQQL